ncbi:hypothetical protein [Enterobacter ludwigii]
MDESRKQFEEWAIKSGHNISLDARGRYVFSYTATAWAGWQASRAAIEIELPRRKIVCASGYGNGYLVDSLMGDALEYDETVEAIRAAGIKVKE